MLLNDVFDKQSIKLNLESKTKETIFTELVDTIADVHHELNRDEMLAVVRERENKMNTSVASGIAVPHGYYPGAGVVGAIGISPAGIDYDAPDHKPVHVIFLIIMGETYREKHLHVLSRILSIIKSGALPHILATKGPQEVYEILSRFN
ncbi:PTS sugar transporter subunit IIA [Treponema primitia]|uniref:PTS sugar transporter subunit IIA n=1 Tax=Treponema primitia TaxID=88058 RepID=UPI00397F2548